MIPAGAAIGVIYWYFWGCNESCPIKANWHTNLIYGGFMGGFLGNIVSDFKNKKNNTNT